MAKLRLSQEFFHACLQAGQVREALAARADRIAARARQLTAEEGVDGEVGRSDGTRPSEKRPRAYSRVTHTNADQEHGTSSVERRRILGRSRNE